MYQPLYATIRDNEGGFAQSSSRHGKVNDINIWINSQMGTVMNVNVSGGEHHSNMARVSKCQERIRELSEDKKKATSKEAKDAIQKKVDVWEFKLKQAEGDDVEMRKKNKVYIHINLKEPEHDGEFIFNLNGIHISKEDLAVLQKHQEKSFIGQLGVIAAFGMIPDINKMVEAEGKEEKAKAVKTFIDKKERIEKFLKEEEEKIGDIPPIKLPRGMD